MSDRTFAEIPIESIDDSPFNPPHRATLAIDDLAASILAEGRPPLHMAMKSARMISELQRVLRRAHDLVAAMHQAEAAPAPRTPRQTTTPRAPRRTARTWLYQGRPHTVNELAAVAGCGPHAMRERLKRLPPEVAVAQGAAKFAPGSRRTFELDGRTYTVADLAQRAGVSWSTMWQRLQRHSAEVAVSFGRQPKGRNRLAKVTAAAPDAAEPPLLASARVRITPAAELLAVPPTPAARRAPAPTPAPEAIVPAGVKRTVRAAPPHPTEVTHAPPIFGRIGHYADSDSAIARAYAHGQSA